MVWPWLAWELSYSMDEEVGALPVHCVETFSFLGQTRYVFVFLLQLHLCPSDRRTSSLGVGLPGRLRPSVGLVLFVVSSLLRHRTSLLKWVWVE